VTAAAPRYDDRIHVLVASLDDRLVPIAETCRRVAEAAERLDLPRPSYVHLRRVIIARWAREDARAEARRELLAMASEAYWATTTGRRVVNAYEVAEEVRAVLEKRNRA
jgi:hypothetical protein